MSFRPLYHSFDRLTLTIHESGLADVRTDQRFELRSSHGGAEVWRSSSIVGPGGRMDSDWRYIGPLSPRRVIALLEAVQRSGIYDELPLLRLAAPTVDGHMEESPALRVSMDLASEDGLYCLLDNVSHEASIVSSLVRTIRNAIEQAQEDSLTSAG